MDGPSNVRARGCYGRANLKPYYEENGITIYHGDCREVLPSLPKADLVLTDPPYGIDYNPKRQRLGTQVGRNRERWNSREWDKIKGDKERFDPSVLLGFSKVILWGANNFASRLPDTNGWLFWDQLKADGFAGSAGQLAWTSFLNSIKKFEYLWDGFRRGGEVNDHYHPNQKPLALMRWCIEVSSISQTATVLDPFMGSGTTLRAAKDLGRRAVGIEIEEHYCETAANRLRQDVLVFA